MGKFIGKSTVIEHKGLAKLKSFCANNIPFLICRDETITDVGIDGEIEISLKNYDGKIEATGERIKFQLKSTESENSYIQNETDEQFNFYANRDDLEYWTKHKQDVLLIIYDIRNDILYGKKITATDFHSQKQTRVKYPIIFKKEECILDSENFDFHKKYSQSIKSRLNFDITEHAITNLFRIRNFPNILYSYQTTFTNRESVYKSLEDPVNFPEFIIYNKILFTFVPPKNQPLEFKKILTTNTETKIQFNKIADDRSMRNHYVELLKMYFKKFLGSKGIFLNKEYNRYYFGIKKGEGVRSILARTRKQGRKSPKEVAKFYKYGKYEFFRHSAFEIDFIHAKSMYVTITPTYLITSDGKTPADGKLASKFIITQKSREFNPSVANNVHTIFSYLSNQSGDGIDILNNDDVKIELSSYIPLTLPFSIAIDDKGFSQYVKKEKEKQKKDDQSSLTLFDLDE